MPSKQIRVSLIGAGKVGSALVSTLPGKDYRIAAIINRTGRPALSLARAVSCRKVSTQISDVARDSAVILIAVDDRAIPDVVGELHKIKKFPFKGTLILHTSGVHTSEILSPLKKLGADVSSFHPIQTFPDRATLSQLRVKLRGICFGIEGDPGAVARAAKIATDLGCRYVQISADTKALYHLTCTLASSHLVVALNCIRELSALLDIKKPWTDVFGPLMTSAMENGVKLAAREALTGPIVRNDLQTLSLHLKDLDRFAPQFLPLYTVGSLEVARIIRDSGKIKREEYDVLLKLFREFIGTKAPTARKNKRK